MTARLSVRDLRVWLDTARGPVSIVDGVSLREVRPPAAGTFSLVGASANAQFDPNCVIV